MSERFRPCPWHAPGCLPWALLGLLLVATAPLFVCLAPWSDVSFFDILARNLMRGGVAYRDILGNNLPGMIWVHLAVRDLVGWSSVAMRMVDLFVVALIVGLLIRWVARDGASAGRQGWLAVALVAFYTSTSEFCHGQRDVWMMLPALAALHLRRRQVEAVSREDPAPSIIAPGLLEGVFWGAAAWVKPHSLVPAVACAVAGALLVRPRAPGAPGRLAVHAVGLFAGGLSTVGAGACLLVASGSWPHFREAFTHINPAYFQATHAVSGLVEIRMLRFERFLPWSLVGLLAIPVALAALWRSRGANGAAGTAPLPGDTPRPPIQGAMRLSERVLTDLAPSGDPVGIVLLSAFFLGWYLQASGLQHSHDYAIVPLILTGTTLLLGHSWPSLGSCLKRALSIGLAASAIWTHPLLELRRLALWTRCLTEGSTPALRNGLAVARGVLQPDWEALACVREYLSRHRLEPGELTCFHSTTIPLYLQLGLEPSTRFVYYNAVMLAHSGRAEAMLAEMEASRHRFVVTDLIMAPASRSRAAEVRQQAPWCYPVVFKAGRYQVRSVPRSAPRSGASGSGALRPRDAPAHAAHRIVRT